VEDQARQLTATVLERCRLALLEEVDWLMSVVDAPGAVEEARPLRNERLDTINRCMGMLEMVASHHGIDLPPRPLIPGDGDPRPPLMGVQGS
jgi:hypothetical protein